MFFLLSIANVEEHAHILSFSTRGLQSHFNPRTLREFFGFHWIFCAVSLAIFSALGINRKTEIAAFVSDAKTFANPGRLVQWRSLMRCKRFSICQCPCTNSRKRSDDTAVPQGNSQNNASHKVDAWRKARFSISTLPRCTGRRCWIRSYCSWVHSISLWKYPLKYCIQAPQFLVCFLAWYFISAISEWYLPDQLLVAQPVFAFPV